MRRWAAREPAADLVVPRAEMKREGVGVMEVKLVGHWVVSDEVRGWSLGSVVGGARRESEEIVVIEGWARRVVRM